MLKFNFKRLIYEKEMMHPFSVLVKSGYSAKFAAKVTSDTIKKLDMTYIENMCNFFNCTPNDLMEWTPDITERDISNHHLKSLYRIERPLSVSDKLKKLTPEKAAEINKLIDDSLKSDKR